MEAAEEAERSAKTESMTGLGNRRAFDADVLELERMIGQGAFSDMVVTVIELGGLKQINDNLGHAEGDSLMPALKRRHQGVVEAQ